MFFTSIRSILLGFIAAAPATAQMARDPETNLVVPSAGQLAWHDDEIGAFYHMNPTFPVNTMTFANFDPVAAVNAAESIGAKHIVVVAKHVDGFCWWPTQAVKPGETANTSNIALTGYKNGQGDVVRELFDEARRRGIRIGVYLATRDDHFGAGEQGSYPANQQAYIDYYLTQATELATQYGDVAEWWLDGGTSGALGAAINSLLATHQPDAAVFQGTNASLRWVGNESGNAPYPCWNVINQTSWNGFMTSGSVVTAGDPDGVRWVPAEVDTPLSTGWFSGGPRTLSDLGNVYYQSVGRGAGLLLSFPVQKDGTIRADNLARGVELGKLIDDATGHPLFSIADQSGSAVTLDFAAATEIDHVILKEDLPYGERVRAFTVEGWNGTQWMPLVTNGTAIGMKQIRKFTPATFSKVRLTIGSAIGTPRVKLFAVSRTGVRPPDLTPPTAPSGLTATAHEDQADLSWSTASDPETGISSYKIYRDDTFLAATTQRSYRDTGTAKNQVYRYRVSATNIDGLEGALSDEASVTTDEDTTAPVILAATTLPGRDKFQVIFSEAMAGPALTTVANYVLSHGHTVTTAEAVPGMPDRVTLTLDTPLGPDIRYTIRVTGVTDDAEPANALAAGATASFFINSFGMTRHWMLDDGTGTFAVDHVGGPAATANRAQLGGATWTSGKRNGGLGFDGNDFADAGLAGVQTNFTIALWVKPQSASGLQTLVGKDRSGVGAYQQRLYLNAGKPGFTMSNQDGADFGLYPFESATALPLNTWTHLAVTNEGTTFKLYVNGQLAVTKQTSAIVQSPYNPANLLLGARWNSTLTGKANFFNGSLDDIRIHDAPLAAEEIQSVIGEADGTPPADIDGDELPDSWEIQQAGNLGTLGVANDADKDGSADLDEYVAGTAPLDAADRLRVIELSRAESPGGWTLKWASKPGHRYQVERSENLNTWNDSGLGDIDATPGAETSATLPAGGGKAFFRVRVHP